MGMIGGGPGAFIGPVHRLAAEMDREIELVAGVFSSRPDRAAAAAEQYAIDHDRAYPDMETMFAAEKARADGIDFVSIVTPNDHHAIAAFAALSHGYPVICDKPMTATLGQAEALHALVVERQLPFALTYTYSGYGLVREARRLIAEGALGTVRKVVVEYPQGWLSQEEEEPIWRLDPDRAGQGGCIADIGIHAFHLAEFVSSLRVESLFADLGRVVPGRLLDDDVSVLLRFCGGARGVLLASQIEVGERNGLRFRIYGDRAGLSWCQEQPNTLTLQQANDETRLIRAGDAGLSQPVQALQRTPGGHPEGYLEAFANLYREFAAGLDGTPTPLLPDAAEGLRSMQFIDAAIRSSDETRYVTMPDVNEGSARQ